MGNFFYILSILIVVSTINLTAQDIPVYNHFYTNPYLLNPAETASDEFLSFTANHRQQWRGVEGAPIVSTFTFQTPFDYKKWALGVNIRNFTRGLITTNDLMVTYAYTVYLTKETTFHFGLSGGLTSNSLNLDDIEDLDDPVLAEFQNDNIQPAANFGMKLKSPSGLNLGIALPRLFKPKYINQQDFESYDFSPFDQVVVMGYFKRPLDKKIVTRRRGGMLRRVEIEDAYAPLQLYALYKYSAITESRVEFLATLHLSEMLWVGAAYRLSNGPAGLLGLKFGGFSFSYAYEPSSKVVSGFEQGTHEVQLRLTIGDKKKLERTKPILRTIQKTESHQARFSKDNVQTGGSDDSKKVEGKKFYVVIKEFRDFNSADDFVRKVKEEQNIDTDIFYNKNNRKFYIYIFETGSSREANKEKRAVEELTKFKKVKIIIVDQ